MFKPGVSANPGGIPKNGIKRADILLPAIFKEYGIEYKQHLIEYYNSLDNAGKAKFLLANKEYLFAKFDVKEIILGDDSSRSPEESKEKVDAIIAELRKAESATK